MLGKRQSNSDSVIYHHMMASRIFAGIILIFGVGILAVVGLGSSDDADVDVVASADTEAALAQTAPAEGAVGDAPEATTTTEAVEAFPEPENYGPRLDLVNLDGWRNTDNDQLSDFDGQVLIVEMWTFGCFNCQNRIPHTQALYAELQDENFEIIGVHAAEFDFEKDIPSIERAMVDLGVTWPVALDTEKENFRAWQEGGRRFWPRTYVVDQNGDIRFDHIGEGDYEELGDTVRYLLANPPESTTAS